MWPFMTVFLAHLDLLNGARAAIQLWGCRWLICWPKTSGKETTSPFFSFPSLDNLSESCSSIIQSRDVTNGIKNGFLAAKPSLKAVLDPITQPLSWVLDGALWTFANVPWFIMVPILVAIAWYASRSVDVTIFVAFSILLLGFVDHYEVAMQTLSIIFV